jgi:hypothetical protein
VFEHLDRDVLGVAVNGVYVDHGLTGTNRERPGLRDARFHEQGANLEDAASWCCGVGYARG